MKYKNYASFIITYIPSRESYKILENYILNKFEYSEIIILINNSDIENIKEYLNPLSDNVLCLTLGDNIDEDNSIRAGLEFSKGDIVFVLKDISIENIENYIDDIYEYNIQGLDISLLTSKSFHLKDKILFKFINIFTKQKLKNKYDILFFVTRRIVNSLSENKTKTIPISYIIRNIGYKYTEIEYKHTKIKQYRLTKTSRSVYLLLFYEAIANMIFILSILSSLITFLAGIYSLIMKAINTQIVNGWTSLFIFLSFGFTITFFILAIIIRYFGVISKEIENKPNFKVISIYKI
ncbi:hypothetical protein [Brachyspira pilosicoli]|uniref:hypothetical protein n=1 Tax=Brachyspira pilosicoli TaxID=52584 RepID=UPI0012F4E6C8|nr:hypothetical protein [Brachyspira pilosicoli]